MKLLVKTVLTIVLIIAFYILCAISSLTAPTYAVFWTLSTFIMFLTIMIKGRKTMKIAVVPLAVVCCVVAYFHGSVIGPSDWWAQDGLYMASFCDYTLYRWSTYIADCATYTFCTWLLTFVALKGYSAIKKDSGIGL